MSSVPRKPPPWWAERVIAWMVTERVRARNPDGIGEAVLVLVLASIVVPPLAIVGIERCIDGPASQGLVLFALAGFTAALPLVLRRTGSLALAGNGLALVGFFMTTQSAWYRGGLGSGTLRTIALVPMLAIFTAGARAGLIWALLATLDVGAFVILKYSGYHLVDRVPASARFLTDGFVPIAALAVVLTSCLVFQWGRRAALDSRSESEARQRALVQAVPDLLFRMSKDGIFLDFHAQRELVVPAANLRGKSVHETMPRLAERSLAAISRALSTREIQTFEYELEIPGGAIRHFEARFAPAADDEVLAIARDITAQRELEQSLKRAEEDKVVAIEEARLIRAERLAAVGQLAAGIGHEINNPLAYVVTNVAYAREQLALLSPEPLPHEGRDATLARWSEVEQALVEAAEGADRVKGIVSDLRTFARVDKEARQAVDVRDALDSALKMVDNELRHRARLARDYEPVPEVLADPGRLTQVFVNLLLNAAHAVGFGHAPDNEIRVRLFIGSNGEPTVEISDTGAGIPLPDLERVFEPFYTTKAIGAGTGLGLPVSRSIVRGYGGELTLERREDVGTTARVTLPAAGPVSRRPQPTRPEPLAPCKRALRVLVVDDDRMIRRSMGRLLSEHTLTMAGSGREALELLDRLEDEVDVVLCDLMMPDMTGMDLFRNVQETRPELARRFVFVTAGAFAPGAREFLQTIGRPCLAKPFAPEELRRVLAAVGRAKQADLPLASVGGLR